MMTDMSAGFYEDDEPVEKVRAAFAAGEKGRTAPPSQGVNVFFSAPGVSIEPASDNHTIGENHTTRELVVG